MTEKQFASWQRLMRFGRRIFRCHQLPERSFHFRGVQLPMCARCTGLFVGFNFLGPLITAFTFGNMFLSLGLLGLMGLDGILQLKRVLTSTNFRRFVTGSSAGYAIFSILVHIIRMAILMFTGT